MYSVSQAYINALKAPAKVRRLTGTIGTVPFTEENVAQGSFQIDNKCADNGDIKLGSVYIGQLTALFMNIPITLGNWMGKQIVAYEELLIGENTWEAVPLGVYTITEANWQEGGVFITAYDNMSLLDKLFPYSVTNGTPWDLLQLLLETGIQLAQTEAEIRALPNGTRAFALYADNDIETYRDFLFWIAQTICCFATIDRSGKLVLRQYAGASVYTMDAFERWTGSQYSDYVTGYTGVSLEKIEDQYIQYVGGATDEGVVYELGANPFLQGNANSALEDILIALLNVRYTPFQVSRSGAPFLDLGDVIDFADGVGDGLSGCIMTIDYTFRGEHLISGLGSNPKMLGAKSKADKEITGLISRTNSDTVQFYTYTNARELNINDRYKEIIGIRFGSSKKTIVTFNAEIKCEAEITEEDADAIVSEIQYVFNREELSYHPAETWIEGTHLLHLLYYFPIEEAAINTLSVRMRCDGAVTIGAADIQAAVSGQGLVSSSNWDGYIECEDEIVPVAFRTTPGTAATITDTLTLVSHDPSIISHTETIVPVAFRTTPGSGATIAAQVQINKESLKARTWAVVNERTWAEIEDMYYW